MREREVQSIIGESYPQLPQSALKRVDGGADNEIFNLSDKYIAKYYPDKSRSAIQSSIALMQEFNGEQLSVYTNQLGDSITALPNGHLVVMDLLQGKHPSEPISLSTDDLSRVIGLLDQLLNFNSQYKVPGYDFFLVTRARLDETLSQGNTNETQRLIRLIDKVTPLKIGYLRGEPVKVTHHDVKRGNIILTEGKDFIIDWDNARQAYAIDEVVRSAYFFAQSFDELDVEALRSFVSHYSERWPLQVFLYALKIISLDVFSEIFLMVNHPEYGDYVRNILPPELDSNYLLDYAEKMASLSADDLR